MVVSSRWSLVQLDINNAFIYGDLFKEVYMDLPLGYKPMGVSTKGEHLVCFLRQSIYGLKPSI